MLKVSENPGSEYAYYMLKSWLFSYIVVDELRLLKVLSYFLECKTVKHIFKTQHDKYIQKIKAQ